MLVECWLNVGLITSSYLYDRIESTIDKNRVDPLIIIRWLLPIT